jgi:hypothetical protein
MRENGLMGRRQGRSAPWNQEVRRSIHKQKAAAGRNPETRGSDTRAQSGSNHSNYQKWIEAISAPTKSGKDHRHNVDCSRKPKTPGWHYRGTRHYFSGFTN